MSWCPNSDLPKRVMFDIFRFREEHLQELCDDLQNEGSVPLGVFSDIYAWTMWLQLKPDNVARVLIALANRWLQANMTQAVAL